MTLAELLARLTPTDVTGLPFPPALLGAFRRKSITFCTGVTDETTIVYWFQSRSFTIDLRLPDGGATALVDRQGWVGDTLWDARAGQLSWRIARSYQPRDQWPEPARLQPIGNCVLEFAPSGAYVEDWRQQATTGPLLGLRLRALQDNHTGQMHAMDGGLILAGDHLAFAQSRDPGVDERLRAVGDLSRALADGLATEREIESYEVSVLIDGGATRHGTGPALEAIDLAACDFQIDAAGTIVLQRPWAGGSQTLFFDLDCYLPQFAFGVRTETTPEAVAWMERESHHLMRHATVCR